MYIQPLYDMRPPALFLHPFGSFAKNDVPSRLWEEE